tara:strand:- start:321 stop:1034 length:714 start_codon:yes stop_codon:yes gene_type:complete
MTCKFCNNTKLLYSLQYIPTQRDFIEYNYFEENICDICLYNNQHNLKIYRENISIDDFSYYPTTLCLKDKSIENKNYKIFINNNHIVFKIFNPKIIHNEYLEFSNLSCLDICNYINTEDLEDDYFLKDSHKRLLFVKLLLNQNLIFDLIEKICLIINGKIYLDYVKKVIYMFDIDNIIPVYKQYSILYCSCCKKDFLLNDLYQTCKYIKTRGEYYPIDEIKLFCIECMKKKTNYYSI